MTDDRRKAAKVHGQGPPRSGVDTHGRGCRTRQEEGGGHRCADRRLHRQRTCRRGIGLDVDRPEQRITEFRAPRLNSTGETRHAGSVADPSFRRHMARKRALVVDDSKSARVILSRMLEKYAIEVDMAESAEQAIEYLKHNRPASIFMDHLMPGMDGLQAVQAIKGNPQTAMIPIMMYTSQEGELYVGQARALGAMGVLPKQVRPVDVSKVLYELHLLPDRRDMTEPALH